MRKNYLSGIVSVLCLSFAWPYAASARQNRDDAQIQDIQQKLDTLQAAMAKIQAAQAGAKAGQAESANLKAPLEAVAKYQGLVEQAQIADLLSARQDLYQMAVKLSAEDASGLTLAPVDKLLSDHLALGDSGGLIVTKVRDQSPASEAGFQVHDVIVRIDGEPARSPEDFRKRFDLGDFKSLGKEKDKDKASKEGDAKAPIKVEIRRAGEAKTLELAHAQPSQAKLQVKLAEPPSYFLGVRISELDEAMRSQLKLDGVGIAVDGVEDDSAAQKAGIIEGDLILEFAGKPITSAQDLIKAVGDNEEKVAQIKLLHHGKEKMVEAAPVKRPNAAVSANPNQTAHEALKSIFGSDPTKNPQTFYMVPDAVQNHQQYIANLHDAMRNAQSGANANSTGIEKRLESLEKQLEKVVKSLELISEQLKKDPKS